MKKTKSARQSKLSTEFPQKVLSKCIESILMFVRKCKAIVSKKFGFAVEEFSGIIRAF